MSVSTSIRPSGCVPLIFLTLLLTMLLMWSFTLATFGQTAKSDLVETKSLEAKATDVITTLQKVPSTTRLGVPTDLLVLIKNKASALRQVAVTIPAAIGARFGTPTLPTIGTPSWTIAANAATTFALPWVPAIEGFVEAAVDFWVSNSPNPTAWVYVGRSTAAVRVFSPDVLQIAIDAVHGNYDTAGMLRDVLTGTELMPRLLVDSWPVGHVADSEVLWVDVFAAPFIVEPSEPSIIATTNVPTTVTDSIKFQPSTFTNDELALAANFVVKGGALVVNAYFQPLVPVQAPRLLQPSATETTTQSQATTGVAVAKSNQLTAQPRVAEPEQWSAVNAFLQAVGAKSRITINNITDSTPFATVPITTAVDGLEPLRLLQAASLQVSGQAIPILVAAQSESPRVLGVLERVGSGWVAVFAAPLLTPSPQGYGAENAAFISALVGWLAEQVNGIPTSR